MFDSNKLIKSSEDSTNRGKLFNILLILLIR